MNDLVMDVDPAIAPVVCQVVARALGRPAEQIAIDANLMADLGAESLDFLDIVFQLEQEFGIEITRGALERAARGEMSEDEFAPAGVISVAGLARLRELFPESAARIHDGLRPRQILGLFSVRTFARIVTSERREVA